MRHTSMWCAHCGRQVLAFSFPLGLGATDVAAALGWVIADLIVPDSFQDKAPVLAVLFCFGLLWIIGRICVWLARSGQARCSVCGTVGPVTSSPSPRSRPATR